MNMNDKSKDYSSTTGAVVDYDVESNIIQIESNDIVVVPVDDESLYVQTKTEQTITKRTIYMKRDYMFAAIIFDAAYLCYYLLIISLSSKYDNLDTGYVIAYSGISQMVYCLSLIFLPMKYNFYLLTIKVVWYVTLIIIQIIYFDIISVVITSLYICLNIILINMDEGKTTNSSNLDDGVDIESNNNNNDNNIKMDDRSSVLLHYF